MRVRRRSKERGEHPDLADSFDAPPTFLNHVVSPQRRFASATLPLADVKATAKALGITMTDAVLAIAAGGLRTLLLDYDGTADRPILASVPTATDKSDRVTGNEISGLMISLPVHIADPLERARLVSLATRIAKEDHEILGPELYGRMMAYLPTAFAPAACSAGWAGSDVPNKLMNVAVSSVIGPRERGHFGGARRSPRSTRPACFHRAHRSTSPCGATSTSSASRYSPTTRRSKTRMRRPTPSPKHLPNYAVLQEFPLKSGEHGVQR